MLDRVLTDHAPVVPYELHTWGPADQDCLIADEHHWHDPVPELGGAGANVGGAGPEARDATDAGGAEAKGGGPR